VPPVRQQELQIPAGEDALCRAVAAEGRQGLFLDGAGEFPGSWRAGPLIAVRPTRLVHAAGDGDAPTAFATLVDHVRRRQRAGGPAETGIAAALAYEFDPGGGPVARRRCRRGPTVAALSVDESLRILGDGQQLWTSRRADSSAVSELPERLETPEGESAARATGTPRTSLPEADYFRAVVRVLDHIRAGNVYQANLCQRFDVPCQGSPLEWYLTQRRLTPAPRSAWFRSGEDSLASLSPETFVDLDPPDRVETFPIKGTRPRADSAESDAEAARELLASEKDRAELLMIVDLERNDLGRVSRPGSVKVHELAALRSFATVHHLVGHVGARLRKGADWVDLIRSTFPGGSITGAPKRRAMEILEELEPEPRGLFTGSLFWFGDDGRIESSILIRSVVFSDGVASIGAGGGIVADSVPESEWAESNHKVAALLASLGFRPEEAR